MSRISSKREPAKMLAVGLMVGAVGARGLTGAMVTTGWTQGTVVVS